MLTEDVFLTQLLKLPTDDTTRLIYADWLEERGGPQSAAKAEFLRLTAQWASSTVGRKRKKALAKLLQQRAAALDTDWLAVVSRLRIENCHTKRIAWAERRHGLAQEMTFDFPCDRRWEDMKITDDRAIRFCGSCQQSVHYCDTIMEARRYAWQGHCIAIDLGVIRRERDLVQPLMVAGRPSNFFGRQEEERMKPDSVSAERERRKLDKAESKETPSIHENA
jgi:uncharacterized protein (TIGR02996 family)